MKIPTVPAKNRKYQLNEDFFELIDTEEKAYFLGLLYADGNVSKTNDTISLTLHERDKEILEKFKVSLEYTSYNLSQVIINTKNNTQHYHYTLRIYSEKMRQDLIKLGCVPCKSLILEFPTTMQVPEHLYSHFIRGYFDGDGCVHFAVRNDNPSTRKYVIIIVSTETFLLSVKNYLSKLNIFSTINVAGKSNNGITKSLSITYKNALLFLEFIYKYSNIYLNRKYNKYQEILDWLKIWVPKKRSATLRNERGELMSAEEKRIHTNQKKKEWAERQKYKKSNLNVV